MKLFAFFSLADYYDNATEGDVIKSKNAVAVFSEKKRWEGPLTTLYPGQGYLFRRMGKGNVTMHYYPQKASNAPKRAQLSAESASPLSSIRLSVRSIGVRRR